MGLAHKMKDLTGQIVTSHNVRVKALGDLALDTKKSVKDFAEERHERGRKQGKELHDFQDGLSKSVEDTLKDFHEKHRKMSSEQAKDLSDFSRSLTANAKKMLDRLVKEHRQMGDAQAKDLSDFIATLTKTVKHMIGDFRKDRRRMSEDRRRMSEDRQRMSEDVGSLLTGFRKTRGAMSAELKTRLGRDAKNIEAYVKTTLKEFDASHSGMSNALRKSLAAYVSDMARGVRKLPQEYHSDLRQGRNFWKQTRAGSGAETAMPSVEFAGKVTTVREAIEKERPRAEGPRRDGGIEARILGYINDRRKGVKVGDMEPVFGVSKLRLGVMAKKLLGEGKIRKEGVFYYPA
jgi:hypothetical protein